MLDQHPHVPLFSRRQPDLRKFTLQQKIQQVLRVPPVVLLLARIHCPDLRRLAHHQFVTQLLKHLRKPPRVAHRLNPYQRRLLQPGVESFRLSILVL
jgi:hypothetical protein